jgi:hypothetical protein
MSTRNLQIASGNDDCKKYYYSLTSSWYFNLSFQGLEYVGAYDANYIKFGCGLRFTNVTIPQGAVITTAYLAVKAKATYGGNGAVQWYSKIRGQAADNAATFSDLTDFDARDWAVAAPVAWSGSTAWTDDAEYQSPEIKTLIQAIVDRPGWSSGNALALSWDDFDDQSAHSLNRRSVYEYEGSSSNAIKLHIEYETSQTIIPTSIVQPISYGIPTVEVEEGLTIIPTSIVQAIAYGTPSLFYPQTIAPSSIIQAIVIGTPAVIGGETGELRIFPTSTVQQISIGSPTILKYVWHVILDGQYNIESSEINRAYVIGRDVYGNPVYGTAVDSTELGLVGERLDFQQEPAIPTSSQAESMASAILSKMRLTGKKGVILIPPNCGQELFDVVQITDDGANQQAVSFRVVGIRFEYNPKQARYQHKLILGAP